MKKDIEWLKREIEEVLYNAHLRGEHTAMYVMYDDIVNKIDQLEKPETLSQEWVKDNQLMKIGPEGVVYYVPADKLQNKLVPKRAKRGLPTIPKFVADFIERTKPMKSLRVAFILIEERKEQDHEDKLAFWIEEGNSETFARAWLDGFTVEKEQKYAVRTDLGPYLILDMSKREWDYTPTPPQDNDIQYAYKFDDRSMAEGIAKLVEGKVEVWEE